MLLLCLDVFWLLAILLLADVAGATLSCPPPLMPCLWHAVTIDTTRINICCDYHLYDVGGGADDRVLAVYEFNTVTMCRLSTHRWCNNIHVFLFRNKYDERVLLRSLDTITTWCVYLEKRCHYASIWFWWCLLHVSSVLYSSGAEMIYMENEERAKVKK